MIEDKSSEFALQLLAKKQEALATTDVQVLASFTASDSRDWTREGHHTCLHVLNSHNIASVQTDILYQVILAEIDVPSDSMDKIWFPSIARDLSGSLSVWINEEAAVALADATDRDDWLSRLKQQDLQLRPRNLKLVLSVGPDGKHYWVVRRAQVHEFNGRVTASTAKAFEPLSQLHLGTTPLLIGELDKIECLGPITV